MARLHLMEFMDQKWFPDLLRDYMTDYLEFITDKFDLYKNINPTLEKGLAKADERHIYDIGAGGGGGMVKISERFRAAGKPVDITLTDYYPNEKAFEKVSAADKNIDYLKESIDGRNVPTKLKGLRTMFLSFHHFKPKDGTQILKNAVDTKQPIAIFEIYQVTVKDIIGTYFIAYFCAVAYAFRATFSFGTYHPYLFDSYYSFGDYV